MAAPHLVGCDVSSAQAAGVLHIDNCVFVGKNCERFEVAARAPGALSSAFRSNE